MLFIGNPSDTIIPALDLQLSPIISNYNPVLFNSYSNNGKSNITLSLQAGLYYPILLYGIGSGGIDVIALSFGNINESSITNFNGFITTGIYPSLTCFKEDTQILTNSGYKLIQDLRKGDLIQTLNHGFKPIDMIGMREIYNPALKERIKDQLYQCSQNEYPEIIEPLIITGCHSILIDEFKNDEQRQKTIELNGNIYVTDNKYRLPVCVDERSNIYETPGRTIIYHFALENDDYYMNYGIYANGLLVESCSKRYLKELSNMILIE